MWILLQFKNMKQTNQDKQDSTCIEMTLITNAASLIYYCWLKKKNPQPESWELGFIWGEIRT